MRTRVGLNLNPNHETRKTKQEHDMWKIKIQQDFFAKKESNKVMTRKCIQK
jgi:hypothetical protein